MGEKDHPHLFDRLVILNVNNLPDGELDLRRFHGDIKLFSKYLIFDAMFLSFRASISLFRSLVPPRILFKVKIQNIRNLTFKIIWWWSFEIKKAELNSSILYRLSVAVSTQQVNSTNFVHHLREQPLIVGEWFHSH